MSDAAERALLDHARVNLWANPMVDTQAIFDLSCLTKLIGQYRRINISGVEINFPTQDYYLAWSLTSLPSRWLGITQTVPYRQWIPMSEIINNCNASLLFYNSQGVVVSIAEMYLMKQYNGTIIICLKFSEQLPDLTNHLYMRTYSNALVVSNYNVGMPHVGQVISKLIKTDADRSEVIQQRDAWLAAGGTEEQIVYFINGAFTAGVQLSTVPVDSYVDVMWDDTIRARIEVDVDTSRSFTSSLDNCVKYIVQRGKLHGRVDYFDDVDFFVYSPDLNYGQYYHRNQVKNVRQLTHSDFAIPADVYNDYINFDGNPLTRSNSKMLLLVRDTLGTQQIPNVECRISTLYRLPIEDIIIELSSPVGQMTKWRAENLEKDAYTEMMRYPSRDLPIGKLTEAYGYHGVVSSIACPHGKPVGSITKVPPMYYDGFVLSYVLNDELFVEEHPANTTEISWMNGEPEMVNFFKGGILTEDFGVTLPEHPEVADKVYRFYARKKDSGVWEDKTNNFSFYSPNNDGTVTVVCDTSAWDVRIRFDDDVVVSKNTVTITFGTTIIPMNSDFHNWRHLDVYKGAKKLIPQLQYVYDGKQIYYVGGDLTIGEDVEFTVINSGDAGEDGVTNVADEFGFTQNGSVSVGGGRYLLDDRNPLVNINGALKLKGEVNWEESDVGLPVENGLPYAIECRFPNIGSLADSFGGSHELLKETLAVDKSLKDYLDYKYPITTVNQLNIAKTPLAICSILTSTAYDVRSEILLGVSGLITMDVLKARMEKYEHLVDLDICNQPVDPRYIVIQPHTFSAHQAVSVTAQEYDFLDKVNHYYLDGKVALNDYFFITGQQ